MWYHQTAARHGVRLKSLGAARCSADWLQKLLVTLCCASGVDQAAHPVLVEQSAKVPIRTSTTNTG